MEPSKVYFTDFHTIAFGDGLPTKLKKLIKKAGIEKIAIYDKYSDADTEAIKAQADFYLHNYTELLSSIDEL